MKASNQKTQHSAWDLELGARELFLLPGFAPQFELVLVRPSQTSAQTSNPHMGPLQALHIAVPAQMLPVVSVDVLLIADTAVQCPHGPWPGVWVPGSYELLRMR